jgi:hypothetical protein
VLLEQNYEEASNTLRRLASLASSPSVRELLLSMVEEMAEQVLPPFKIAEPNYIGAAEWRYENPTSPISIEPCRSRLWRRLERSTRKVYDTVMKAKKVWDFIKDIADTLKDNK